MEKKRCVDEDLPLPHHLRLLHKEGCLIQILLWLPVVSLLTCKSVCKSLRDLIQSSFFIDLHTTNTFNSSSSSSSKFGPFILHVSYDAFEPALLMFSSQSESESVSISGGGCSNNDQEELVVDDLEIMDNLGIKSRLEEVLVIVGSCNGLVCLHRKVKAYTRGYKHEELSLWNPATEEYWILPESITIIRPTFNDKLVVFGFDAETKDYKVVQFTSLKPMSNGNGSDFCFCQVQVYSLNTNSWRLLEGIPCLPGYPFDYIDSVLYLNGTGFFLAHFFYTKRYPCVPQNNRFIISFDFTKEIINPIQLPDHDRNQELCLCSLADKIALFTSPKVLCYETLFRTRDICEDFNIWVLNYEHGSSSSSSVNKKSWTKLYSFQIQLKTGYDWYIPRGISNDGKFAFLATEFGKKMKLYNLLTNEVKRNFIYCRKVESKAHAYKPSLVSVIGGNGAGSSSSTADMVIF